ncbi:reticuline oxidase-like protein-like protein [Corchorus capsularis]|uniref:Reticuline oxidase-like protein-like protein n=1 Tax=Corchorus capsularis TaxID=210143 RepID=A0A1R3K935_COCAP|nr:reticuline oxidase-like protein-like protein [Corchorus capsularis]
MMTGGVSINPLDGDQGISVLQQKNDALQRWEQHNKQMDLQFRRFDELSDEIVDRLDNLVKIYARRRQVDNRKPRVEMAHGDPIEKPVSVCRNPVDNRKPGVEIARGPIERPEHVRRNPIYDKGFEENRQRQPFRTRCTINDMEHSKIILGKPWQFDEGAQYSYDDNVYKIRKEGKEKETEVTEKDKEIEVTQRKDESVTIDKVAKDGESVESKTPDQYVTVEEKQKELVVEKKSEFSSITCGGIHGLFCVYGS